MKKILILTTLSLMLVVSGFGQEPAKPKVTFAGGVWIGSNINTTFIGFMGPKLSLTTNITKKMKMEVGLNGIPGLIIRPDLRLAPSAGVTIIFKKEKWKMRPVLGVMFVKTTTWQCVPGIGFVF